MFLYLLASKFGPALFIQIYDVLFKHGPLCLVDVVKNDGHCDDYQIQQYY